MFKRKYLIVTLLLIVTTVTMGIVYFNYNPPELIQREFEIEYGELFEYDVETLLDTTSEKVLDSIIVDVSDLKLVEDHDYPEVGEYTLDVTYQYYFTTKKDVITLTVHEVKDAEVEKPPTIKEPDPKPVEVPKEPKPKDPNEKPKPDPTPKDPVAKPDPTPKDPEVITPTIVKGIIIVNKKHPVGPDYTPGENSVAANSARVMISDMQKLGYDINNGYSGYRTYQRQEELYNNYVRKDGVANADTYSARPGHSEHQTGLTFDLKHSNGQLVTKSPEVDWISENAHKYGFIVRYKPGKEGITGYQAEPWHLRYIGDEAVDIYNSKLSLEEYLNVEGGDYK